MSQEGSRSGNRGTKHPVGDNPSGDEMETETQEEMFRCILDERMHKKSDEKLKNGGTLLLFFEVVLSL